MSVVTRNVIPERRGKGWPRCERGGDSDQKTWIKPPKETNMAVDALEEELKMEQESVYEQRLYCNRNHCISYLQPNNSYSKRRCHCSIVLFFCSVLFCYFFTHISERSIQNTLNDARSNPLLDETMGSPPVSPRDSHFQFSSPQLVPVI